MLDLRPVALLSGPLVVLVLRHPHILLIVVIIHVRLPIDVVVIVVGLKSMSKPVRRIHGGHWQH